MGSLLPHIQCHFIFGMTLYTQCHTSAITMKTCHVFAHTLTAFACTWQPAGAIQAQFAVALTLTPTVVWNRDGEMLVHSEDVSSKTVPRKKKQTVFQRVYAVVTTSKPKRGANVAGRPWIVTFRNVSVEGQVVRARRSSHERRKSRTLCSGLSLWHDAVLFLLRVNPLRGKNDGVRTKQLKPPTPDGTAWPITPQDWERSGFGRRWERLTQHQWSFGRWRRGRSRCGGCGGPNNGTDPDAGFFAVVAS